MMKPTESDLMKGIDDKFQKLLSQFEMNMNILELKSKRQQFIIDQSKDDTEENDDTATIDGTVQEIKTKPPKKSAEVKEQAKERKGKKEKKEEDLFENDSVLTVKEVSLQNEEKTKSTLEQNNSQNVKFNLDTENDDETALAMGNVLKYISECAEMKSKGRKKKKNISFIQNESEFVDVSDSNSQTTQNLSVTKKQNAKPKKNKTTASDNQSGTSSKKLLNNALVKKCSKTVTNISKKGKKRNLKNARNIIAKDWISYNRNNVAKLQKKSKSSKTLLIKKEDKIDRKNSKSKDSLEIEPTEDNKVKATIDHFETVENKLINDFFKNDFRELTNNNAKIFNDANKNAAKDKINFKSTKPIRALFERNAINGKSNTDIKIDTNENSKKNFTKINRKKYDPKKYDTKKFQDDGRKLMEKRSVINNAKPRIINVEKRGRMSRRLDDGKSVLSNVETRSQFSEIYTDMKENSLDEVSRAKSEIRMDNRYMNSFKRERFQEKGGDLEEVKVELDEFFSEIPFVVGRSISRTFNLGLSFQHAMSLLRRMHSKKDVKEVLSIGRLESEFGSESLHCLGSNHCEAIGHPEWSKEDEEAWEENPWDPELNRRRPKCTCLPNNCTTLKNVLKQLAIKNPGFQMKPLHPSLSATSNNKEAELDLIRKPALKRAQSQTRTELLRNIRNIQIQLTPSSEILK